MNETSLGPERVQGIHSSHGIGSFVSDQLFTSSLPVQIENASNEGCVRDRLAVPGQPHEFFSSKAKQGELTVRKQFWN
jgi:hypothetical protein